MAGMPRPLYPSDAVIDQLDEKFGSDPNNVVWIYTHDDMQNKCAQERVLGVECKWLGSPTP